MLSTVAPPTDPKPSSTPVLDYRPPGDERPNPSLAERIVVRLVAAAASLSFLLIVPPFIRDEAAGHPDSNHPIPAYALTFGAAAWFAWVALGCPLARRSPRKPTPPTTESPPSTQQPTRNA
jgi:hypothetical protein